MIHAKPTALDPDALQRLRELDPKGTSRLLERVLRAFETAAARLTKQLAEARLRDDTNTVRLVAHTLKSSSASIGALALSRICAEIEAQLRREDSAGLAPRLDALDLELSAVLQAVKPLLDGEAT